MMTTDRQSQHTFAVEQWAANSASNRASRASLVLTGAGRKWRASAVGNGAVDALLKAVDRALEPVLGEGVELTEYVVEATGRGHDAAATVHVSIRPRAEGNGTSFSWDSDGRNILGASVAAYLGAINELVIEHAIDVARLAPAPGDTARHEAAPDHEVLSGARGRLMGAYNS